MTSFPGISGKSQVSRLQDFFGRLVEKNPRFFLNFGRFETRWMEEALSGVQIVRPIYVAGLARSGSTILLELLASHHDTVTHRYKDFPFIHIPVWWNWFLDHAARREVAAVERAHKDGMFVTPDSPEALEEVLWMAFFRQCHDPMVSNILDERVCAPDFEAFYRDHICKILLMRGGSRYLAKGNYNLSRLGYLSRLFPDAYFIIPVREPISHIASLMKQHKLFREEETHDPRVLAYMQRAGHFEFGLDRRPINFGRTETILKIRKLWSEGQEIKGWAAYWAAAYSFAADLAESETLSRRILIVPYDDLCVDPAGTLHRLYRHCELNIAENAIKEQTTRIKAPGYYTHSFSNEDIAVIRDETDETAMRIGLK